MSLSAGSDGKNAVLSFSWFPSDAKSPDLGRYGEILLSGGDFSMRLSSTDVLGSMKDNVRTGDTILFPAQYYENAVLRTTGLSSLSFAEPVALGLTDHTVPCGPDTAALSVASSDYHAIKYFFDGILLPVASVTVGNSTSAGFGFTWTTTDPTETYTHVLSSGYQAGDVFGSYSFSSTNLPVSYSVSMNTVYGSGWGQKTKYSLADGELRASAEIAANWSTYLSHPGEAVGIYGLYGAMFDAVPGQETVFAQTSLLQVGYGLAYATGTNPYDSFKFQTSVYLSNLLPGITVSLKLPRLLWWRCDGPDVTNIPFSVSVTTGADIEYSGIFISASARAVLYSREIQWSPSILGLYFRRAVLDAVYDITYTTASNMTEVHRLTVSAVGQLSPIIGSALPQLNVRLGLSMEKDFLAGWGKGWTVRIAFGVDN